MADTDRLAEIRARPRLRSSEEEITELLALVSEQAAEIARLERELRFRSPISEIDRG